MKNFTDAIKNYTEVKTDQKSTYKLGVKSQRKLARIRMLSQQMKGKTSNG